MSATPCCEQCGTLLPPRAPGGLCPKCLIEQALQAPGSPEGLFDNQPSDSLAAHPSPPVTPARFGDYELLEKAAEGGMGVVYRARQLSLDRIVAVKTIQPGRVGSPEMVLRFRAEAEAAASLHHPNIVPIHETGECEGQHYFSMDYIEGKNLAEAVREGPLLSARAAQIVAKIAAAVHYAHQHRILHRDLKPSNVILDEGGEPHVTDFGLARRLGGESTLTLTGQVFGSPRFMPPEQAAGRPGAVGVHTDVYGLGAILYYLLTARPPFVGETVETTLAQVLNQDPVSPRLLNASVPRDLETICLKCLEKEPARRYATAGAVADDLARFLNKEPILARPVGPVGKAWRWCRRKPLAAGLAAGLMIVLALGFSGVLWQWRRAAKNELFARQNAYAADMMLAQHALTDNNVRLALSLLNKHRPADKSEVESVTHPASPKPSTLNHQPSTDLRGWEWRYLWQLCQADTCVSLQTNPGTLGPMAISQNGKVMAVATGNNKIAVWDLTGKRLIAELPGPVELRTLGLSRTGRLLGMSTGSVQEGPAVEVWHLDTGKRGATFEHRSSVRSLAFSPDETLLATFDEHGTVALLDWAANHALTNFLVPHPGWGGAGIVAFSPDGTRLAVGQDWGRVDLLDWRTGKVVTLTNLTGPTDYVSALAFSPATELLAAGSDKTLRLRRFGSGESREFSLNSAAGVSALAFTPDGKVLASASGDQSIQLWSVADQAQLRSWRGHHGEGRALAFMPDGQTLVSGCNEGAACFWDVNAASRLSAHAELTNSYPLGSEADLPATNFVEAPTYARGVPDPKMVRRFGFAFTPDSRSFLTTDRDGWLGVWDAKTVRLKEWLPELGSNLWGVALSPDGRWLAAGQASGTVEIWDWQSRNAITNLALPFGWLGKLLFSRSGKFLLGGSGFRDSVVHWKVWRTSDWAEIALRPAKEPRVRYGDLSPDDRHLATGYWDGVVKLWSFPEGRLEAAFTNHTDFATVLFSHDGQVLVSASHDGTVRFWDVATRRGTGVLRGHLGGVWAAAVSPDGRRLATGGGGANDAVKLWGLATQRELLTLQGEGTLFFHVAFSPDGSTLMGTSFLGVTHLWRAPSWEEIAAAEKGKVTP